MADSIFTTSANQAMSAGLREPFNTRPLDPAMRTGLGGLQATGADAAISGRRPTPPPTSRLEALQGQISDYINAPLPEGAAPLAGGRPPATAYYNRATNEMFVGDRVFKADDIEAALRAAGAPANTTRPEGAAWTSLPEGSLGKYVESFTERRSKPELLGRGVKQLAYAATTLPGTVVSLLGAEETGAAIRAPFEYALGDSKNEQLRSQLIAQNSSFWDQVVDASVESLPILIASMAGGVAGAARLGAGATSAARTSAAVRGASLVNMPIHLASMYDAAVRNQQDLSNPLVKTGILAGTLANTALDSFGIERSLLSPFVKEVAEKAARKAIARRAMNGLKVGAVEGVTEVTQTVIETLMFDQNALDKLTAGEIKAFTQYAYDTYGDSYKVAGAAGALLGGGAGSLFAGAAARNPKTTANSGEQKDLTTVADQQATPQIEGPQIAGLLPAPERAPGDLYGQQSFQPLGLPYDPNAPGGTIQMPGETMEFPATATGPNVRPLTPQQIALLRGRAGQLQPGERAGTPSPLDPRTAPVLPPMPAGQARLLGLPPPPSRLGLPAPLQSTPDFYAGPEGLTPAGMSVVAPEVTPGAPLSIGMDPPPQLVGMDPPPLLLAGQTTDTLLGNKLRAATAARDAETAQQAADQQATAEAARQAQLAEGRTAEEIETAYVQRDIQQRALADNQVRVAEERVATARTAWDKFRNQKRLTLVPKAKRTGEQSVEFDMLPPAAQQKWLDAVGKNKATEKLYKQLRKAAVATPAAAPAAEAQPTAVVESNRETYPDGNVAVEYRLGDYGFATVQIAPDKTAHLTNIQIGDENTTLRGEGRGTQAYAEIGQRLAKEGVRLQSTQWSKHNTAISPAALRVWEKLTTQNLARKIGEEKRGKVLDRTTGEEEVRAVPIYEFGPGRKGSATPTEPPPATAAAGVVSVYRARRTGSSGKGVGEAAYGIGEYWTSDQKVAERYKGIVPPVTLTGPDGRTVELNRRDTLTRIGITTALRQIGVEPTRDTIKAVSDYVAKGAGTLPDDVTVAIGTSEVATADLDTSTIRPQTAKAELKIGGTTYNLNSMDDIQMLRSMGLTGTSYREDGATNYVLFPPPPAGKTTIQETGTAKAAARRRPPRTTTSQAAPKSTRSQAAPVVEPDPEVQAPTSERVAALRARVENLTDKQAIALQDTVESNTGQKEVDLDKAIESDTKVVEDALAQVLGEKRGPTTVRKAVVETLADISGVKPAAIELKSIISEFNSSSKSLTPKEVESFQKLVTSLRESNSNEMLGLSRLTDYANADGTPNIHKTPSGKREIRPTGTTPGGTGRNALATFNTLNGAVDLDGKPVVPLAPGRVQMAVRKFVGKLARKPTITVARNQADLKATNPALYRAAKASRPQGDFDTAPAMGFAFGDGQVIVFTDLIATEQQLNFVLAHETLGHFGLRGVMPASKFDATMEQVYKSDPVVAAAVNQAVEVHGMSRAEATEEYLADYAAVLDMSLLRRVAAAMKNALNTVGFRFSDDMVRHLLRTSRRYVRNGGRPNLFVAEEVFRDVHTIESGVDQNETGRFLRGFKNDNIRMDQIAYDSYGGIPRSVEAVTAALKPKIEGLSAGTEKAIRRLFSLTTFNARDNAGLSEVTRVLLASMETANAIRNKSDELLRTALNREFKPFGIKIFGGITETEQLASSYLNYAQQDAVRGKVDDKVEEVMKGLRGDKVTTRMFTVTDTGVVPNQTTIDRYAKAGRLELEQARKLLAKDPRYKAMAKELHKDHPAWLAYKDIRTTFEYGETEFVRVQYEALLKDRDNAMDSLYDLLPKPPKDADKVLPPNTDKMFKTWTDVYVALYSADASVIEDNLVPKVRSASTAASFNRTVNEALLAKGFDTTKEDAIRKFFKGKEADDFIAQLVEFRKSVVRTADNEFVVQRKVREYGNAALSYSSAEQAARKMLVQGYTPIVRAQEGYQIRPQAFDAETGEMVQMNDTYKGSALYRSVGTMEEGTVIAKKMTARFADAAAPIDPEEGDIEVIDLKGVKTRTYKMPVRAEGKSEFRVRNVVIRFDVSAAATGVSTPLNLNLNEFIRGLRQYGLNIQPEKLEKIVVDMSAQNARARKRLEQTGNPGYQIEGGVTALEAMAQHVDGRAALTAKISMRPTIDRLMNIKLSDSRKLWFGDKKLLDKLKAEYDKVMADPQASDAQRFLARANYTDYAYKMKKTITNVNGIPVNLGNKFLSEAHNLLNFVNANRDLNESDWGSGPVASWVRSWMATAQLGGTLSQPIMNNIGPLTNFVPWLATFNDKTGFGGGAGVPNAYAQYFHAMSDVGGAGGLSFAKRDVEMHTSDYWDQVAAGLTQHANVSTAEAKFIAEQTRSGVLTPAQANSLLGASRNYTTNPALRRAVDKWMFFYMSSEQATRRASALAAFRVEWGRQLAARGMTEAQLAKSPKDYKAVHTAATSFAADGVRYALGEYGNINRPAAWRSGLQSFLYMYRVWPTTSIQTLSRLDNMGKALFLLPIIAMSGLAGLPFAEDGEDIVDTLLQRTGQPVGSVRLEMARMIDEIMPGKSGYILNGLVSSMIGVDTSGKFSMGDFIPGTEGLLPGANAGQTMKDVVGPAWGFLEGIAMGGSQLVAAPFSDTATLVDAMRSGPITLFRALGDAAAYTSAGAVVDKRGYKIDEELTTSTLVARVFGFSSATVASKYELVRLAKRETNYQKQVVAKFRIGLLKAEMSGDRATAASIRRTVREWNEVERGTLLEIKNFEKNYQRVKQQAYMSVKQRLIQSAGKANQDAIELIDGLIGYD